MTSFVKTLIEQGEDEQDGKTVLIEKSYWFCWCLKTTCNVLYMVLFIVMVICVTRKHLLSCNLLA